MKQATGEVMSLCDNLSSHPSMACLRVQSHDMLLTSEYLPNLCRRTTSAFYFALALGDKGLSQEVPHSQPIYIESLRGRELNHSSQIEGEQNMGLKEYAPRGSECELRRVLPSVPDLRTLALAQPDLTPRPHSENGPRQDELSLQISAAKPQRYSADSIREEDYCQQEHLRKRAHYKSYQEFHILSMYQDNASLSNLVSAQLCKDESLDHEDSSSTSLADDSSSEPTSPTPRTPTQERRPSDICLPKTPGFDGRGYRGSHVRMKSYTEESEMGNETDIDDADTIEVSSDLLIYRTLLTYLQQSPIPVLAQRGRPRLVEISRFGLTDHGTRFSHSNHSQSGPSTPRRDLHEVSAFSPYDTPATSTPFSDLSRTASDATPTPRRNIKLSLNTQLAMFQQQFHYSDFDSQRSSIESQEFAPCSDTAGRHLAEPFETSFSQRSTAVSSDSLFRASQLPSLTQTASRGTSCSASSRLSFMFSPQSYELKLKRANSTTNGVFKSASGQNFDLTAPEMAIYKPQRLETMSDIMLISSLNGIFPQATPSQISSLLAWLLVDLHYIKLFESAPAESITVYDDSDSQEFKTFSKSMNSATPLHNQWSDLSQSSPTSKTSKGCPISTPLTTSRIPSKAASVLGLGSESTKARPMTASTQMSKKSSISSTEHEARTSQASARDMACSIIKKILGVNALSVSPQQTRQKGLRAHIRGRSALPVAQEIHNEALDRAVQSLWQACRCIVGTV